MTWLRKLRTAAVVALLALVVAILAAFAWMQTAPGKRQLAQAIGRAASDETLSVEIAGLDGFLPFDARIAEATVADADGIWLRLEDAALDWSPASLLLGRLDIEALTVRRAMVDRQPIGSGETGAAGAPSMPVTIRIAQIEASEIVLAEPVLGAPVRLSLEGMAELADPDRGFRLVAGIRRIDATPGDLDVVIGYEPDSRRLTAEAQAAEPPGGVVARLLDLPGLPAVALDLAGDGPVDNWRAQLAFDAGPELAADAEIGITAVGDGHLVTVDAGAALSGLADGAATALLAGRSTLGGRVLIGEDRRIALDRVTARIAGGTLTVTGQVDWPRGTLDTRVAATPAGPDVFAALAPDLSWGHAEADLRLLGQIADPRVEATAVIRGFRSAGITVSEITADILLDRLADGADGGQVRVWGEGSLVGTSLGVAELDPLLAAGVAWQVSGDAGLDGSLSVEQLRIAAAGAELAASGNFAPDAGGSAAGTLSVADIEVFRPLATLPIGGRADLSWRAQAANGGVSVAVEGAVAEPRTGIAEVDALLSDTAELEANVTVQAGGSIGIDGLRLASGANLLSGTAAYADDRLVADWDLTLPSIAALSPTLGLDADGRVTATGRLDGPMDHLSLRAEVVAAAGVVDGIVLPDLTARVELDDVAGRPAGSVRLEGDVAGAPAWLESGLALTADGGVRLAPISADYAGVQAAGAVDVTADGMAGGRVSARADDVATLTAIFDIPLSGQAEVVADLEARDGRQDLRATIDMLGPVYDTVAAASAAAEVSVADLAGERRFEAGAGLSGLAVGGARFDQVDIDARGGVEALTVSLAVAGTDLSGEASASIDRSDQATRIGLDALQAEFRGAPFALAGPATVTIAPDALSVDRLVLQAGGGRMALAGSLGERMDATIEVEALPIALLALVEPGLPVSGTIDGAARISGPASQPEGSFELRSTDLRSDFAAGAGMVPAAVDASGRWSGGRMALEIDARLADGAGLDVVADLPFRLSADGRAPMVDRDARISGRASGALDVALFDDLLAAAGNRVGGRLVIDLEASGTVADPVVAGTAVVRDGLYENAFYGSRLDGIAATIAASGTALRLTELSATTPGGGTLSGSGSLALDPEKGYPLQLDAALRNGAVVDTALASVTADADLRLSGGLAEKLLLAGEVSILAAEFRIPDRLPVSVPDLPVEEVNLPPELAARRAEERPSDPAAAVDADLDIVASARQAVFVRGRGLDVELQGDITIRGSAAAPAIGGDLVLRSGTFDILGQRLAFQRGALTFGGSSDLDPELDLLAGTRAADATVEVEVGGRVSEPTVTLRSVPELPQDEIAARLLFGKDVRSLSAFEAVTLAQSVGQLTGLTSGAPGLLEQMRQRIGLDRLDVDVGEESGAASVSGGRYVGEGVYVGVEQGLDDQSSRVNVEIELTPNVKVESDVGADAEGRIGVNLEWDY